MFSRVKYKWMIAHLNRGLIPHLNFQIPTFTVCISINVWSSTFPPECPLSSGYKISGHYNPELQTLLLSNKGVSKAQVMWLAFITATAPELTPNFYVSLLVM